MVDSYPHDCFFKWCGAIICNNSILEPAFGCLAFTEALDRGYMQCIEFGQARRASQPLALDWLQDDVCVERVRTTL